MPLTFAHATLLDAPVLLASAALAAMLVLAALKVIGAEIDFALRVRALHTEAQWLREQQIERLRNLLPRRSS